MELNAEKSLKSKTYEVFKIFENDKFATLMNNIQLADCMKSEVSYTYSEEVPVNMGNETDNLTLDLTISDTLTCSYCHTTFKDKIEQRSHYKLDWHRHNLKLNLKGMTFLSEDEFSKLAEKISDDVSSISGSETEEELCEAQEILEETEISLQKQFIRHSKIFFINKDDKIISLYRCVLHGKDKEGTPVNPLKLCELAQSCPSRSKWAILMIGGGHFAAAVFDGNTPVLHKTFHSYTVRSKQGGSQSSRDSKSGTSHPKSAGASLRRYNEASFQQHIQDVLESWKTELDKCDIIFLRAVSHNRSLIFSGKNTAIQKNDPRIRSIPFPTRRATYSEVKRTHELLSSVELYGSADAFLSSEFPVTPKKQNANSINSTQTTSKPTPPSSPEKSNNKKKIDRAKARLSPCRPLPEHVELLAAVSSTDEEVSDFIEIQQSSDFVETLQEFDDDVPEEQKTKHNARKQRRKKKSSIEVTNLEATGKSSEKKDKVQLSPSAAEWSAHIMAVRHDTELLKNALTEKKSRNIDDAEALLVVNQAIDSRGNTLLHQASCQGMADRVTMLLEYDVDPTCRNFEKKTAFKVAKDWETKKAFRIFQANFPDKYDYEKAEVPGGLTEEGVKAEEAAHAERKKAQKKAKRDRLAEKQKLEAEKRKLEEEKKKEQEERDRFLSLSDREKRAIAAERRVLASGGQVIVRCFLCAADMTGQVPFSYQNYNFCSMPCLKAHRFQNTKPL